MQAKQKAEQYVKYECQTETCKRENEKQACDSMCGGKYKLAMSNEGKLFKYVSEKTSCITVTVLKNLLDLPKLHNTVRIRYRECKNNEKSLLTCHTQSAP